MIDARRFKREWPVKRPATPSGNCGRAFASGQSQRLHVRAHINLPMKWEVF